MENKRILFLSPYPEGKAPSQRLKFEQYFPNFEAAGYQTKTISFFSEKSWDILYKKGYFFKKLYYTLLGYLNRISILFQLKQYDVVYVHLWITPFGLPFFELLVRKLARKMVYDIDDMIFLGHSSAANKIWKLLKGRRKIIYLMKTADQVITCTPKLDKFVRQFNQNTTDISSTVDTSNRYKPTNRYKNDHQIMLGWSGSHSTSKYLYLLSDVFKSLARKHDYKLMVMGDKSFDIKGVNIEAFNWKENIEIEALQKFDIGLYPLPNEEWVYGKSGLKAIQYMALGIPTIATAIGANFRVIQDEQSGFLIPPDDYKEWEEKIERLITNPEIREKMGKAARKTIVEKYSLEANKDKYLNVLDSVING